MVARRTTKSKGAKMTKLDTLKTAAAAGDWKTAFSIAARFPRLGEHRGAILDAHMAFTNPRFLAQVRRDPAACIEAGKEALRTAYKF